MFKTLLNIRFQAIFSSMFNRSKSIKKNSIGGKILFALLFVYVGIVLCFSMGMFFFSICEIFSEIGLDWFYFALAGIAAFVLSFVGSVFMAKTQLFESSDNDLLMSMPIKPSAILSSRMAALLGFNFLYQSVVLLPALVVYLYVNGFSMPVLIMFILCFIALPFLVLTVTGIGGYLLQLFSAYIPSKNIIETLFYIILLAVYLYFYSKLSSYMTTLIANGKDLANAVQSAIPPAYFFGNAIANAAIPSLIYFLLCAFIPCIIMHRLLSVNYIKIMGTKHEASKKKYKGQQLKASSIQFALLNREFMHFINDPMYIMNAALGTIFLLIASVILILKKNTVLEISYIFTTLEIPISVIIGTVVSATASMNMISAPSISIERNSFWLIRSLPVDTCDVLIAKAVCHFAVTIPAAVLAAVTADIILNVNILGTFISILLPTLFIAFHSLLGVVINLHFPKLDWINEVYAIKQSASSIIAMLLNLAAVAVPAILYFIFFDEYVAVELYTTVVGLFVAAADIVLYNYLKRGGKRRFEAI